MGSFEVGLIYFALHKVMSLWGPGEECGDLNENVPSKLKVYEYLVPGRDNICKGLGGEALLEEACHWEQARRVHNLAPFPVLTSLSPVPAWRYECSAFCSGSLLPCLPHHDGFIPLEPLSQISSYLLVAVVMVFYHNRKVTNTGIF